MNVFYVQLIYKLIKDWTHRIRALDEAKKFFVQRCNEFFHVFDLQANAVCGQQTHCQSY